MEKKEGSKVIFYEDERGAYVVSKAEPGVLPAISVNADTIPAAWELAMLACWNYGARVGTHYDTSVDTPKSKEATITVKVSNPFNEPRICLHYPGGPEELEIYRQEVVNGIHDHWIEPGTKKWTYTYHERLTNYNPSIDLNAQDRGLLLPKGIDQIEKVIDDLKRDITSKGAQAITWMPTGDPGLESNRPCLQRLWFRPLLINENDEDKGYLLNLNSHWRSRDLAKAWFMNVYAITDWQREIAQRLEQRIEKPVKVGSYTDISDSLHIYGDYFEEYKIDFDERMKNPNLEKRVWNSNHPAFQLMTEQTKQQLLEDVDFQKKERRL